MRTLAVADKDIEANYHVDAAIEQIDSLARLLLECEADGGHGEFKWTLVIEYEEEDE